MRNGGCLGFIAAIVVIGMVLLAIKWFGIPVGLALAVIGFIQFKRFNSDPEGFDGTARSLGLQTEHLRWACIGSMVVGVLLVISSAILWSVPTNGSSDTDRNVSVTGREESSDSSLGGRYVEGPYGANMCDQPGMAGAEIRRTDSRCRNAAR